MTYWSDRQRQLAEQLECDEEKLKKRLASFYDGEVRKLERQIAAYYQQYGMDHVIQYRSLMEALSETDRRLLIEQMDEFAKIYPQYAHLMPVRASIYRLNRLEGLQHSVRMQQLGIGAVNEQEIAKHLHRQALRGVNAAAEAMGFGKSFYAQNPDITKLFVNVPWSNGKNFSSRIWDNADKLANYLNTDIAQGFARGDAYDRLVGNVRQRFGRVARNDAYRLIYTEGTYVLAESTMQPFLQDFEKYRLSTVGDGKVCPTCRGVAQEVFSIKDRQPGVNFPPLHPWCRCVHTVVVDDWDKWTDDYVKRHGGGSEQAKTIAKRMSEGYQKKEKKPINVFNEEISFSEKMTESKWNDTKNILTELTNQYNTRLRTVSPGAHQAAGTVDMGGNMRLSDAGIPTAIHEFAHSIALQNLTKYGVANDSEFWKELRKIRTKYRRDVGDDTTRWISHYEHSSKFLDEFFAESFAHAKMKELGINIPFQYGKDFTYSDEVLKLTDKYFKKSVAKTSSSDIIKSGAVSGARNPYGKAAEEHAKKYYGLVRNMKTDVQKIAKTTGYSETEIQRIKDYIFTDEHDLGERGRGRFDPDYMMGESWRRLIEGKPEAHDLTMLHHEIMEQDLVEQGFSQDEAHRMTSAKYNYDKEACEFYGKIKKFKKE